MSYSIFYNKLKYRIAKYNSIIIVKNLFFH
ncbi:Uncharacterised protein [Acinetobacter ursingii]|nr:Uncharacterised protein [Acinetobacter ursingii]